ncbi:MAG TPA: hypothetical protein PKA64_17355, partial [Myxococcota bacterium]|nr:hypothetical protein [Myxococcota bacterium]
HVVHGLAHALLAEILRRRADEEDVIFGDPANYHAIIAEAQDHFAKANALDPSDEYSSYHAFFLGIPGKGGTPEGEPPEADDLLPDLLGAVEPGEA